MPSAFAARQADKRRITVIFIISSDCFGTCHLLRAAHEEPCKFITLICPPPADRFGLNDNQSYAIENWVSPNFRQECATTSGFFVSYPSVSLFSQEFLIL